jgi:hypothetical protein
VTWKVGELSICPGGAGASHPSGEVLLKPEMEFTKHLAMQVKEKAVNP